MTGNVVPEASHNSCTPAADALRRRAIGGSSGAGAVVGGAQVAREAGQGWVGRNKYYLIAGVLFSYVLLARMFGEGSGGGSK